VYRRGCLNASLQKQHVQQNASLETGPALGEFSLRLIEGFSDLLHQSGSVDWIFDDGKKFRVHIVILSTSIESQ
jgi:hypothetical protein